MIKVVNIVVLAILVVMLAVGAVDKMRSAASASASAGSPVCVAQEEPRSELAPDLCVLHAPPYMFIDEISGRRGLFLEQLLSIFPKARLLTRESAVSDEWVLEQVKTNPRAAFVTLCPPDADSPTNVMRRARLPVGEAPVVLLTLRGQRTVEPEDLAAHPELKVGIFEEARDAVAFRPFLKAGRGKVYSGDFDSMETALREGEIAAFAVLFQWTDVDDTYAEGYGFEKFRMSKPFATEKLALAVSSLDPAFADALIRDYEAGLRRLERSGERRRIHEYYGLPIVPLDPPAGEGKEAK